MKKKILSLVLCAVMCIGVLTAFSGCSGNNGNADAFVIMTEQLDGLFNPFFYTSAPDGTIVSMTQIGMLSSKYADGEVKVAYGDNEAVVVKDYDIVENGDKTVYTFVIKNGIKFSDGQPLTMEDILFNYYVYLDPVYTGSNTLYSTDIVGLAEYRTQTIGSASDNSDDLIASQAASRAAARLNELINLFNSEVKASATKEVGYEAMKNAISSHSVSNGYKTAISNNPDEVSSKNLLEDYEYALKLFKEELETDYVGAQESFIDEPYKSHEEFKNEIFCFMYTEGYVEVEYAEGADGKKDHTRIETLTPAYPSSITTKEAAIDYIYNDKIARELNIILQYWATAATLNTEFTAKAKEVILHENIADDGTLAVKNISGIVSLGHSDKAGSTVTVNGNSYKVASAHNSDGTVTNADEYDVLQITINGVDPKAIWNFAITVAPQHYYGEGSKVGVDIKNNQFGVEFASFEFMTDIIQSTRNIKLPMGAGAYKATNTENSDTPAESEFYTNNVVYFKANQNFNTVGAGIENAKIEKIRYQVVSSANAIAALEEGNVHYISPALTPDNYEKLENLSSKGMVTLTEDQLGYGYIGVNASKIPDINIRKAIMCAMNTSLAIDYYRAGTAEQIFWPMSKVSWAYPKGTDATDNGHDYPPLGTFSEDIAKKNVEKYMQLAGVSAGDSDLKVKFTIAGSSLQDHPTYKVFRDAASLLNSLGWDVEVVCDTQALTKINTGSLEVWAAAWSSALDPDMYQVYHKDSTATSTLAWGYNYLRTSGTAQETEILEELSELIDKARETNDQSQRSSLYKDAMSKILDLAIELPVYQRSVLYAYNSNVIASSSLPAESELNPFSSPLDRIWEVEFAE
ncbi:MAG: hypothetical protein E7595_02185 [Ruminococcaceae bacterium]|nr:hypothetical protein [Oscillospiraceae bacterium]